MSSETIRKSVQSGYGKAARGANTSCCHSTDANTRHAIDIGYADKDLDVVPDEANMGLGCGNPSAIADLSPGDVVLDLGSGAGMDAFLAASKVGESGHVIGVDMTPEMLGRARDTATHQGLSQFVEFRRGYIEDLPVTPNSVDVVLSNCVINLSPDKDQVFKEAYRVLKPGGRLAISDICLSAPLPHSILEIEAAYIGCITGAMLVDDYRDAMINAGFTEITGERSDASPILDGACADPVLQDALSTITPDELDTIRNNIWSYRFTAEKSS